MRRLTWALAAFALAGPARADVIYSNLGPGESYRPPAWGEAGPDSSQGPVREAFSFTVGGTDTFFDGARLALGLSSGANEIDLRLYNDAGGHPGSVFESMHVSGQMPRYGMYQSGHLVAFDSATHPLLRAGGTYWLLPFASGDTYAGWNFNNQGRSSRIAGSFEVEPTTWRVLLGQSEGAFEVNGTPSPVPEPAGFVLAGVGLTGVAGYAWRRRKPAAA